MFRNIKKPRITTLGDNKMNFDALNNTVSAFAEDINYIPRLNAFVDPVTDTIIKGVGSITDNIETLGESTSFIL